MFAFSEPPNGLRSKKAFAPNWSIAAMKMNTQIMEILELIPMRLSVVFGQVHFYALGVAPRPFRSDLKI